MFHDQVELFLQSGKGGDGSASFRREKYIPKGGPDGGDGGRGGDVYIVASGQTHGLNHLASVRELKAKNGVPGAGQKLFGKKGDDLTVTVPVGTRIYRQVHDSWRLVKDMQEEGMEVKVLTGGEGGLGNVHFATATNQAPKFAQPGEPGQRALFKLELMLIADVGVIGMPNAGKSTFLSIVSDAKPKIAAYPFTTLSPVLGVVRHYDNQVVFADIPGLIEGASEGKGLGHTFLRHVQRTKLLVHFIDSLSDDYARDYRTIRNELKQFDESLAEKPEIVVITKSELISRDDEDVQQRLHDLQKVLDPNSRMFSRHIISAVTNVHIPDLLDEILAELTK